MGTETMTAIAAKTGVMVSDEMGEFGSATAPNHWSVAIPMLSITVITNMTPMCDM